MKFSFGITTHNEGQHIQELLDTLITVVDEQHAEIVIVDDYSSDPISNAILDEVDEKYNAVVYQHSLELDFAGHKNFLNSKCNGEYILQLDADELPSMWLLHSLTELVQKNPTIELFLVPRVNIVTGLTEADIKRWGWQVNDKGWVMFPDYQTRLYANKEHIRWEGKVHERIVGNKTFSVLPAEEMWAIKHFKDIATQISQNNFYQSILTKL